MSRALSSGRLSRGSCEVCGEHGQARHDSCDPEPWLDARWLCPEHHMLWHAGNEAQYPTIFEFHPSNIPHRKGGRPNKPWFRKQAKAWCVTINRKQVYLGTDKEVKFRIL